MMRPRCRHHPKEEATPAAPPKSSPPRSSTEPRETFDLTTTVDLGTSDPDPSRPVRRSGWHARCPSTLCRPCGPPAYTHQASGCGVARPSPAAWLRRPRCCQPKPSWTARRRGRGGASARQISLLLRRDKAPTSTSRGPGRAGPRIGLVGGFSGPRARKTAYQTRHTDTQTLRKTVLKHPQKRVV